MYSVYCTLPTSAQLQYDVCCLWRRHVELRGKAAAQATHTARRPTRRNASAASAWQSSALATRCSISISNSRTYARRHATLYSLHSTLYTLHSTLQAITLKSNVRVPYISRAFEERQTIAARKIVSFSTRNKLTSTSCLPTCFRWINFPIFLDITMQFVIRTLC